VTGEPNRRSLRVLPVLASVSFPAASGAGSKRRLSHVSARPRTPLSSISVATTRPTTPDFCVGNTDDFPVPLPFGQACPLSQTMLNANHPMPATMLALNSRDVGSIGGSPPAARFASPWRIRYTAQKTGDDARRPMMGRLP